MGIRRILSRHLEGTDDDGEESTPPGTQEAAYFSAAVMAILIFFYICFISVKMYNLAAGISLRQKKKTLVGYRTQSSTETSLHNPLL